MALTEEQMKIIISEAKHGFVTVGGSCPNACIFCCLIGQRASSHDNWSNKYYMTEEELDEVIPYVNQLKPGARNVFFGEGQYHLSCEPFKHPNYIGLLKRFHKQRPELTKVVSTVGKYISDEDLEELKKINILLVVSVNSFDLATRKRMMKSKDEYDSLINLLVKGEPSILKISLLYGGDLKVLENDIKLFHSLHPNYIKREIKLGIPDYSRYHSEEAKSLYEDAEKTWNQAIILAKKLHPNTKPLIRNLSTFPPEVSNYEREAKRFDARFEQAFYFLEKKGFDPADTGFLLAESVFSYAVKNFPEYESQFIYTPNIVHGGSYMVAGLLTKDDFLSAIEKHPTQFKTYALPRPAFNREGNDLLGYSYKNYGLPSYILA